MAIYAYKIGHGSLCSTINTLVIMVFMSAICQLTFALHLSNLDGLNPLSRLALNIAFNRLILSNLQLFNFSYGELERP